MPEDRSPEDAGPSEDMPATISRLVRKLAREGAIAPDGARTLAKIGFLELDLVGIRIPGEARLVFEFVAWTEMGALAADWMEEQTRAATSDDAAVSSDDPVVLIADRSGQVALCEAVIGPHATATTVRRDHARAARGWYDDSLPKPREGVREVRLPKRPPSRPARPGGPMIRISERRVRAADARKRRNGDDESASA